MRRRSAPRSTAALVLLLAATVHSTVRGADFAETFDGDKPSCRVHVGRGATVRVLGHRRVPGIAPDGSGAEEFQFEAAPLEPGADRPLVWLEHEVPPARVFEELTLKVRVQSNVPAARLLLRVVLPDCPHPATGEPLVAYISGEPYTDVGAWQPLTCTTTEKLVQQQIHLLRAEFPDLRIDAARAYVDRAYVVVRLGAERTGVRIDDLRLGPIVDPPQDSLVQLASAEESDEPCPVQLADRLLLNGQPFFPRIMSWHGEPPEILRLAGANVVWVPDFENEELLTALQEQGLWAAATPPRALSEAGGVIDTRDVSMLPFTEATRPILFWMLGTRVPPEARDDLLSYVDQVRSADARFRRPLMVDIAGGDERAISRHVPMLGVSRHVVNTSFSFKQYRDWLIQRRHLAQQGSLLWTWIQTEPASEHAESRQALGQAPIVVEPEQIRLQVYAALAAGCRGLGFWKRIPLDSDAPGALERRLMIAQLSLELDLLAPWIAGGSVENQLPFSVEVRPSQGATRRGIDFAGSVGDPSEVLQLIRERQNEQRRTAQRPFELEAAIIRSDRGTLVLPIWYETDAQYVPGQMAGNNAQIRVEGVPETACAWEVTTTSVKPLKVEHVPGGRLVKFDKIDQTAAIIVSSDRSILPELYAAVQQTAEPSARICVQLAKAKLERVEAVDAELQSLGQGQSDAYRTLHVARMATDQAAQLLERGDWDGARVYSAAAMEALRILQRSHWDWAVAKLSAPVSSPHASNFQTLPDHWRLIARLGRSGTHDNPNLLRSGDFEDRDAMIVEEWQHAQNDVPGIEAHVQLYPVAQEGEYSLRLAALPKAGQDPPLVVPHSPVLVTSPAVTVHAGQIVHISGWIRISTPITGGLDGVMLYDSLIGPVGALRWHHQAEWQRFSLIREVPRSGELSLTAALSGMGEVQFDDLRIVPHNPRLAEPLARGEQPAPPAERSALNFLERLPRLGELPSR